MRAIVPWSFSVTFKRPPDVSIRQWRTGMRDAWRGVGQHWQQQMLPRHFTRAAAGMYGHKPRTAKYLARKRRGGFNRFAARLGMTVKYGGEVDNVLTGRMEESLRLPARIIAFPSRVTIRMIGPRYMTFNPRVGGNQPNKPAELTRLTSDEREELSDKYHRDVLARFRSATPEPLQVRL
jgi:hypothetical protein